MWCLKVTFYANIYYTHCIQEADQLDCDTRRWLQKLNSITLETTTARVSIPQSVFEIFIVILVSNDLCDYDCNVIIKCH